MWRAIRSETALLLRAYRGTVSPVPVHVSGTGVPYLLRRSSVPAIS